MARDALTPNQLEVLRGMAEQSGMEARAGREARPWLRPMDIGARDGSHHSATMKRLAARGLLGRRRRGTLMNALGGRGSFEYRLTAAGAAAARREGRDA